MANEDTSQTGYQKGTGVLGRNGGGEGSGLGGWVAWRGAESFPSQENEWPGFTENQWPGFTAISSDYSVRSWVSRGLGRFLPPLPAPVGTRG